MEFRDQVKTSVDIVKVIGEYVRLKRMGGTGRWTGLCPFHQEKTPSFNVNQTHQFYKCFGCDAKGDVFNFLMQIDGLTFPEALKSLAETNGIPMPKRSEFADAESKLRGVLLDMHASAAQVFHDNLKGPQGADARAYLARRGVSPEMMEVFGLGYADPSGQALVRRFSGITADHLEASGLIRRRQEGAGLYDFFRGRLMFPIHDETGKVIAFGGRAMRDGDEPKYLNSSETPIYRKTSVLYNLHRARGGMREGNRAVLVEGYMDVIGAFSAGVKEVVASCGTSLTSDQVRNIHRHADTIVVNFDPDKAGSNAAEKALQLLLDEGLHVRILTLDGGLDPDEYVKQNGADVYRAKLDTASEYFHWLADRARARYDMRSHDGRMDVFKFLLPSVQKIGDKLARAAVADDLASYLGVDRGLVLDQFKKAATERQAPAGRAPAAVVMPPIERILLGALMGSEQARAEVLPLLTPQMTEGFLTREIFEALREALRPEAEVAGSTVFSAVEGRLSPAAQALLHQVVAADDMSDEVSNWEQAQSCLRQLQSGVRKRQVDELRSRVKLAEREGRVAEALEWMTELHRLEREMRAGAGGA
jgi:DNA primase